MTSWHVRARRLNPDISPNKDHQRLLRALVQRECPAAKRLQKIIEIFNNAKHIEALTDDLLYDELIAMRQDMEDSVVDFYDQLTDEEYAERVEELEDVPNVTETINEASATVDALGLPVQEPPF